MRWWMPTRAEFATATEPADATATADALTRPLRLLSLAGFASMASMRWCDALLPLLAAEFGSSTGQAAQTVAAFAIAYGLMQLVYGPLGDRHGKFTVVSWATLACTAGAIACAVAPGLGWLTAARALNGAAAAAVIPLTMAWIGDRVPMDQRQAVLARMLSATVLGMIAGQWLAGVFADTLGWRAGFVLLALAFGAAGLAMRRFARTAPPPADAAPLPMFQQMRTVLALPAARWLYAVAAVEGALAVGAVTFVPSLLQGRFGLSASAAGAVLMGYGLGGLLYTRAAPWMLRRASSATVAGLGTGLMSLSWLALAVLPDWRAAPLLCGGAGLGFYMLHSALQTTATQIAPAARGTAVSLFASALFFGQSIGVWALSWAVDRSGPAVGLWVAGLLLPLVGWVFVAGIGSRRASEPGP
jgi:YNFM family putative membrane transporter